MFQRFVHSFGTLNYGTESSTCHQSYRMASELNFGALTAPDIKNSDLFIGWAYNPFYSGNSQGNPLEEFRERGGRVIIVDPKYTPAAKLADIHLRPDPGTDGGVYGVLCAAADAISSARPGARQESLGEYVQRLESIEKLARAHKGVVNVYAVQAGRDLRVLVDPAAIPDKDIPILAGDICRDISSQLKFPGLIKVTVIRELRCVEYAK